MPGYQDRPVNISFGGGGAVGVTIRDPRCPECLHNDNGPGFVARVVCQLLEESGCQS